MNKQTDKYVYTYIYIYNHIYPRFGRFQRVWPHATALVAAAAVTPEPCSGFLPKTKPMQHSCSHSNAICNHSFKKRKEPRTQAEHGTTTRCRTQRRNQSRPDRPQPQPPHTRGTFHRRLQPLYTEKYKVSCSGFLPNTSPIQHLCSIPFLPPPFVTTLHQGQFFFVMYC